MSNCEVPFLMNKKNKEEINYLISALEWERQLRKWIEATNSLAQKQIIELEEALRRRRNLFNSLEESINEVWFPSISERALRLKKLITNSNEEFKNSNDRDFWMEQFIKLNSNPIN